MRPKIQVILGPPGTGKTTYLLRRVEKALARGVRPERIGLVTFTKKAAQVAKQRAMVRFNLGTEDLPWFRTLHSWGFVSLGLTKKGVLSDYSGPAKELGLPLRPGDIWPHEKGDQIYHLINLARISRIHLEQAYNHSRPDFPYVELERAYHHLQAYKLATGLVDYTDILAIYLKEGVAPDLDLLLVDEAQDLSRLQWEVVMRLAAASRLTVVAGDDDQAIYGWAGADTRTLLNIAKSNPSRVLGQSYRVPRQVQGIAANILSRVKNRVEKQWEPREEEGLVIRLEPGYSPRFFKPGSYMLLARATYSLVPYAQELRSRGLFYTINDYPSFPPKLHAAIELWEEYRTTGRRPKGMAISVRKWMSQESIEAHLYPTVCQKPWWGVFDLVGEKWRLYWKAMQTHQDQPTIRLSTIHRVKGDEADHILLLTDVSGAVQSKLQLYGPEEEARVFYVGATRARETLAIINGEKGGCFFV